MCTTKRHRFSWRHPGQSYVSFSMYWVQAMEEVNEAIQRVGGLNFIASMEQCSECLLAQHGVTPDGQRQCIAIG